MPSSRPSLLAYTRRPPCRPDVESRGTTAWPLPHHLVCVEKLVALTAPYLTEQAVHEMASAGWEPDAETVEALLRAVASRQGSVQEESHPSRLLPLLHRFLPCVEPASRGPLLLQLASALCEVSQRCGGDAARLDDAGRVVDALRFQDGAPPPLAAILDEAAFGAALRQLHASLPPAGKPGESAACDRLRAAVEAVAAAHNPASSTAASGGAGEEA